MYLYKKHLGNYKTKGCDYMGTIIARLHTPEDDAGERDVMHPETSIDAVLDPVSGVALPDRLAIIEDQLVVADNNNLGNDGFITAEEKQLLHTLGGQQIELSADKPNRTNGCLWIHFDPSKTEIG